MRNNKWAIRWVNQRRIGEIAPGWKLDRLIGPGHWIADGVERPRAHPGILRDRLGKLESTLRFIILGRMAFLTLSPRIHFEGKDVIGHNIFCSEMYTLSFPAHSFKFKKRKSVDVGKNLNVKKWNVRKWKHSQF